MFMSEDCDVFEGTGFSVADLRAAVFGPQPLISRPLAVMLLGQRRYPRRVADLQRLLTSSSELPRIRALAAQQLSLVATPAALAALRKGLLAKDPVTLRSVVEALAWAGDLKSLAALDRVARRRTLASDAARWAALLLRFRHGKSGGTLPRAQLLRLEPRHSVEVPITLASSKSVAAALRSLRASAPSFTLSARRAMDLRCGERKLMVLLDAAAERKRWADELFSHRALVGVIAEQELHLDDDSWDVSELLLTEPLPRRRLRIAVVAPNGRRVLDGEATRESGHIQFRLAAVRVPGAVPTTVVGSIGEDRIQFQQILVGTIRHPPMRATLLHAESAGA
jgi:hypothetical protein